VTAIRAARAAIAAALGLFACTPSYPAYVPCATGAECFAQAARVSFPSDALPLYERACDFGHAEACARAAARRDPAANAAYRDANLPAAARLFGRACDGGYFDACVSAAEIAFSVGLEISVARARLQTACDAKLLVACLELARAYARGLGGDVDEARAMTLAQAACAGGEPRGCEQIAYFVYAGIGGPRDVERARDLFEKACAAGATMSCAVVDLLKDWAGSKESQLLGQLQRVRNREVVIGYRGGDAPPLGADVLVYEPTRASFSGATVSGWFVNVRGFVTSRSANEIVVAEGRSENILQMNHKNDNLVHVTWAARRPSLDDAACASEPTCAERGLCSARDGFCVVGKAEDCARSTACSALGRCEFQTDGRCVVSAEACRKSKWCGDFGECAPHGDRCAPASASDCRASKWCRDDGWCSVVDERVDRYDSRNLDEVRSCRAASAADCASSDSCKRRGQCKFRDGMCEFR
jgi:hypothetical protein